MGYTKAVAAIRDAERRMNEICDHPSIGEKCRRACLIGGMEVISEVLRAYGVIPLQRGGVEISGVSGKPRFGLGIIVSSPRECPKGFEVIYVKSPRNKRVMICRLGPEFRRKFVPKGKPYLPGAHTGALRRKKGFQRGIVLRPILESE